MKNVQTKVHVLDQEQTRQQELIYSAEFQIQQMERKVARGMGERTDEEKSILDTRIRELEVRLLLLDSPKILTDTSYFSIGALEHNFFRDLWNFYPHINQVSGSTFKKQVIAENFRRQSHRYPLLREARGCLQRVPRASFRNGRSISPCINEISVDETLNQ